MANSTTVPDVLNDQQKAVVVRDTLQALQTDALNLQMARIRSGNDGSAPSGSFDADGNAISYDDRGAQLEASQRALVEQYSDVMPEVKKLLGGE